jgi:hypothetical protein
MDRSRIALCLMLAPLAAMFAGLPPSSSLAEERASPLDPPPRGGARFPTLAARYGIGVSRGRLKQWLPRTPLIAHS